MELTEAILERRSIRKFTDYYVTDKEIEEILEAGRWAPSWANTQTWEFIAVRDKDLTAGIASTYPEGNPAYKCTIACSALIACAARTGVSGHKAGFGATKFNEWFMFDMGMAVQNMWLKIHELGLGTVVVGLFRHDDCKKILGIPEGFEIICVLPLGKPESAGRKGPGRKNLEDFVYLNQFGTKLFNPKLKL